MSCSPRGYPQARKCGDRGMWQLILLPSHTAKFPSPVNRLDLDHTPFPLHSWAGTRPHSLSPHGQTRARPSLLPHAKGDMTWLQVDCGQVIPHPSPTAGPGCSQAKSPSPMQLDWGQATPPHFFTQPNGAPLCPTSECRIRTSGQIQPVGRLGTAHLGKKSEHHRYI